MSDLIQEAEEAQKRRLDFQREQMDRAAVASGDVDENSALYRHAKLNGWAIGSKEPFHGQAGRKWWAAEQAAKSRMLDAQADIMEADADLRAGFDGIVADATAQRLDRARRGRATLGSIVGHAMRNGGMVPKELAPSVGMELGDPGFVGGTLAKDGTFISMGRGKDGDIQPTGLVSSMDVTKAMVDSGNWRDAQKYVKQFLKGRLTDQQIESATGYSDLWAQQTAVKDRQRRSAEIEKVVLDGIRDMLKEKPDMTPGEAWRSLVKNNPKALESYLTRPATEEEVNNGAADEKGNVSLSPEEGFRKFESLWNLGKSGGAAAEQSGNPRLDQIGALIDRLEKMNAPAPADPNAVEMRQRANARMNVIDAAGGRQQRILEVLPNGQLAETSGYVVNGRVYDANGDERQGQFLDEYRRPIVPAEQPAQGQRQVSQAGAAAELARREAAQAQGGAVGDMAKPVATLGGETQLDENGNRPDSDDLPAPKPMTDKERRAEAEEWAGHDTPEMPAGGAAPATSTSPSEAARDESSRSGKLAANAEKVDDKAIENLSLKDQTTLRLAKKAWEHIKNGLKLPKKSPDTAADASLRFLGKFFAELDERGLNFDTSAANTRSEREIQEDPHDGDRLPLDGGGYAVFNAKTDMWEALNDEGGRGNGGVYA